ncbi:hypothetical protein CesoFtcFv8_024752 [Champsocephalus esox]|uniref:Uncharacterized protein n=1 Tax=Champsocephalus esox TaxID=159716 RepID=A0AAN8B6F6_9TELE|nr:hypothetical protein CesoFtcFv8_024752 [Champsocephalus esox]
MGGKGDSWCQCTAGKPPARTRDDITTDGALAEEVDSEGAISGPKEEDRKDISPAVDSGGAIDGPEKGDREDISPASTRKPPSAGQRKRIRKTSL